MTINIDCIHDEISLGEKVIRTDRRMTSRGLREGEGVSEEGGDEDGVADVEGAVPPHARDIQHLQGGQEA